MSEAVPLDRDFAPVPGQVEYVADAPTQVRRIVAPNGGPFTFTGTNTFIVGRGDVAIIDPGPEDAAHRAAIETAIAGERLSAVIVTHTHRDHSPLARPLAEAHGAIVHAFGPHVPARPPRPGETVRLDAGGDTDFRPDVTLADGEAVTGPDWQLSAVHTPGHTANHICLALGDTGLLFAGDHVMAWSTTVVAPPDGSMADYMRSLARLAERGDMRYLPAHGGEIAQPNRFVRALISHRRQRESAILARLRAGDRRIPEIVERIYRGLDPQLVGAAALSVLAHLEDLAERGTVTCNGDPSLKAEFAPA